MRKLGLPGHEELAMGAIASGGVRVLNEDIVRALGIPESVIALVAAREERELERRERDCRDGRPALDVRGRTVILVDDGLATGSSMRVAAQALRKKQPVRIVVAVQKNGRRTPVCHRCAARFEPIRAKARNFNTESRVLPCGHFRGKPLRRMVSAEGIEPSTY